MWPVRNQRRGRQRTDVLRQPHRFHGAAHPRLDARHEASLCRLNHAQAERDLVRELRRLERRGEEVSAWVRLKPGQMLSADEVKDYCRARIAQ